MLRVRAMRVGCKRKNISPSLPNSLTSIAIGINVTSRPRSDSWARTDETLAKDETWGKLTVPKHPPWCTFMCDQSRRGPLMRAKHTALILTAGFLLIPTLTWSQGPGGKPVVNFGGGK